MGPKKSKKKQQDTRGYATISVPIKKAPAEKELDIKIENPEPEDSSVEVVPTESPEELEQKRRIAAEIIHMQKSNSGTIYRGQLYPKTKLDIYSSFNIDSRELFEALLEFTKQLNNVPTCWLCPLWNYQRVARVFHALCGAGLSIPLAREAVSAMKGYDERACIEWAIENHPDDLPVGWSVSNIHDVTVDHQALAIAENEKLQYKEQLSRVQQEDSAKFLVVKQAKELVAEIDRENDTGYVVSNSPSFILFNPPKLKKSKNGSRTEEETQLLELKLHQDSHDSLCRYRETLQLSLKSLNRKEQKSIRTRLAWVNETIALLASALKQSDNAVEGGMCGPADAILQNHDPSSIPVDARDTPAESAVLNEAAFGVASLNIEQPVIDKEAESVLDTTEPEDEGGEMMNLFGDDEECEVASDNMVAIPTVAKECFDYVKTNAVGIYCSPRQLATEMIPDKVRFVNSVTRHNCYKETAEVGPISASTGKLLSRSRGVFLSATPELDSLNTQSAKELACLKLLFDVIPTSKRPQIVNKLYPCAAIVWNKWVKQEAEANLTAKEIEARECVAAIESALSGPPVESRTVGSKVSSTDASDRTGRTGASYAFLKKELIARRTADCFPHEASRTELPATQDVESIVAAVNSNEISVICGETGCGKSTQLPQLLLRNIEFEGDDACVDKALNIIITEPRRVAAVSVSNRVSEELGDGHRSKSDRLCGYSVRLDSQTGPNTVLEYVTIGVLLRRIQATKGACLANYSHVVVDEVHERSVDSDLLLLLLREYKSKSKDQSQLHTKTTATSESFPRIVLMSATADVEAITSYWSGITDPDSIANLHIPGRTFPVEACFVEDAIDRMGLEYNIRYSNKATQYRDEKLTDSPDAFEELSCFDYIRDSGRYTNSANTHYFMHQLDFNSINYELLFTILKHEVLHSGHEAGTGTGTGVVEPHHGSILIFMPGLEEIRKVIALIESDGQLARICTSVPMHSSLSADDLQRAFARVERGKRKIVVSTNICETGVTIEDVDLVLDTGFMKSVVWNEVTETSRLRLHMCSAAEATQRKGRAGRVRAGKCIHLFPRFKMDMECGSDVSSGGGRMKRRPEPEMKRAALTAPILSLTDMGFGPGLLLSAPGNTVSMAKLTNATQTLLELGAIVEIEPDTADGSEETPVGSIVSHSYITTPLGAALASLPCDPRSGKMLLAAHKLGCLHAAAIFVASLDSKSVFMRDCSNVHIRKQFDKSCESDAATVVNAYSEWKRATKKWDWCKRNGVLMTVMTQAEHIAEDLVKSVHEHAGGKASNDLRSSIKGNPQCIACMTNIGLHDCVTSGTLEALHASIVCGMGSRVCVRADRLGASSSRANYISSSKATKSSRIHASSYVTHPGEYIVYCHQMINDSGNQSLLHVSTVNLYTLLLFAPWLKCYHADGSILVGKGIGFQCSPQLLVMIRKLKTEWENLLMSPNTESLTVSRPVDSNPNSSSISQTLLQMLRRLIEKKSF